MRKLGQMEWSKDARGHTTWRARSSNGNILCDSGEGYHNLADARKGRLSATKILMADLTDEEFYAACAYRMSVRIGGGDGDSDAENDAFRSGIDS